MKLVKHIANLGYGSRREVQWMFREGRITDAAGEVLYADDPLDHDNVRVDGEPLDPPAGQLLMLHKPVGTTCSTKDPGRIVYDLLPPRYRLRSPRPLCRFSGGLCVPLCLPGLLAAGMLADGLVHAQVAQVFGGAGFDILSAVLADKVEVAANALNGLAQRLFRFRNGERLVQPAVVQQAFKRNESFQLTDVVPVDQA